MVIFQQSLCDRLPEGMLNFRSCKYTNPMDWAMGMLKKPILWSWVHPVLVEKPYETWVPFIIKQFVKRNGKENQFLKQQNVMIGTYIGNEYYNFRWHLWVWFMIINSLSRTFRTFMGPARKKKHLHPKREIFPSFSRRLWDNPGWVYQHFAPEKIQG